MTIIDSSDHGYRDFFFEKVSVTGGHGRKEELRVFSELYLGEPIDFKPTLLLDIGSHDHGYSRWSLSPAAARLLAKALREAADFQDGYHGNAQPPKPWPFGSEG